MVEIILVRNSYCERLYEKIMPYLQTSIRENHAISATTNRSNYRRIVIHRPSTIVVARALYDSSLGKSETHLKTGPHQPTSCKHQPKTCKSNPLLLSVLVFFGFSFLFSFPWSLWLSAFRKKASRVQKPEKSPSLTLLFPKSLSPKSKKTLVKAPNYSTFGRGAEEQDRK